MSVTQPTAAVVEQVSELLLRQIGLRPESGLRGRLRRCVRDGAAALGQEPENYLDSLLGGGDSLQSLVNRVTVQESAFFRHPEHFALLAEQVLPALTRPVTIWSAACGNGQEAFSLAMLLEELDVDGSVIATDLSSAALRRTVAARYSQRELASLSAQRIARHVQCNGSAGVLADRVRARVTSFQHNLLEPIPRAVSRCQIVFCRNVLIYFSAAHSAAFLDRLADALPTASLFLGAAESIWHVSDRYDTVRAGGTFSYRPRLSTQPRMVTPSAPVMHAATPRVRRPSTVRTLTRPAPAPQDDTSAAKLLAAAGQQASATGDVLRAVIAFRKCVYLVPRDPIAHLNLGLALDTAGDSVAAQRAYAAARLALADTDPAQIGEAIEGYTHADLIGLLDAKQRLTP